MIVVIVTILTLIFVLASISPLLITDDMRDLVQLEQSNVPAVVVCP